uniref:LIM zinc-binding domain-containing protein n=1 Tax=Macrostomum lignano TaxID=282301 RepID=A0A1I8FLM8_9PLAT
MPTFGVSPTCPVCQQKVYFAEEVKCLNNSYHKLCLKCSSCSKTLDSSTVNDHNGQHLLPSLLWQKFWPQRLRIRLWWGWATVRGKSRQQQSNRHLLEEPSVAALSRKFGGGGRKVQSLPVNRVL